MITIKDLREVLADIPGHYKVLITFPEDECAVECVTLDKTVLRLCASKDNMPDGESLLYPEGESNDRQKEGPPLRRLQNPACCCS